MSAAAGPIRLLLVEDVPQVAQYVRGLLNAQSQIKLVDVVTDGGRAVAQAQQLRPDVVIVDWLLQGRTKGEKVIAQLREAALGIPVIVLTVPQSPVARDGAAGIDAVLGMPFSGFELVNVVVSAHQAAQEASESIRSKLIVVYAPKGGVGKTTIAFNLAVALGQAGTRTSLVDGSLQFGDLRSLLRVPADAPSILDLPTDRIGESDLQDVLWRDPSGIDILLAPPRVEMAEMVSVRDVEKSLSLLRRLYGAVVVDMPSALGDIPLALLDAADVILEIVTYDSTTIRNTLAVAEAFRAIGYPAAKIQYVVNRADSTGGIAAEDLARALGRVPEHTVISDGKLVVQANNEGLPFVLASPDAPISRDIASLAAAVMGDVAVPAGRR
ncbi:MAG: response regulator [Chloroflexi bacterium]|jgi:pilus assembly protein CpaE|nr:response regulator [Chloroflexota bacterium]